MATVRRVTAELILEGPTLSGSVTDHHDGRTKPFHGWLELIAILQPPAQGPHGLEMGDSEAEQNAG